MTFDLDKPAHRALTFAALILFIYWLLRPYLPFRTRWDAVIAGKQASK